MSTASPGAGAQPFLRIIDANLNRIGEGLRLLEEVARLALNDSALTEQLKTMRHDMLRGEWSFHQRLLQARDAGGDVGIYMEVPGESKQREIPVMVMANARRVQESLRLMEELAKLPGLATELPSDRYKEARFLLYSIEQKLLSRLHRLDKRQAISGAYVIIGPPSAESQVEVARRVLRQGARTIRFDDRLTMKKDLLPVAQEISRLCQESGALFVIYDQLDLVIAAGAGGLHIGQEGLPAGAVRGLLPLDRVLGVSVDTVEQALAAESDGADYVAVSGEKLPGVRKAVSIPVVATGGTSQESVARLLSAGADSIAVVAGELPDFLIRELRAGARIG